MEVMAKFRADRAGRQDPNSEDNGVEGGQDGVSLSAGGTGGACPCGACCSY